MTRPAPAPPSPCSAAPGADSSPVECPRCGQISGNDWSQCPPGCPMPQSPHFRQPLPASLAPPALGPFRFAVTDHDNPAGYRRVEVPAHVVESIVAAAARQRENTP